MTAHHARKSSTYRFHDTGRSDRKFLIVAMASGMVLLAVLSGLLFNLLQAAR